jgi:hypothetical protein
VLPICAIAALSVAKFFAADLSYSDLPRARGPLTPTLRSRTRILVKIC